MKTAIWCNRSSTYKSLNNVWLYLLLIIINNLRFRSDTYNIFGADALRVRGEFDLSQDFFLFLAKFGFQKTDIQDPNDTQGVIYGNISLSLTQDENINYMNDSGEIHDYDKSSASKHVTLAVLDRGYFLEFYGNKSVFDKGKACEKMFNKISTVAYDSACLNDGEQDFIRRVPCDKGELCPDEDNPNNVLPKSQLTYRIQDLVQSRFWYVSMVACIQNRSTCKWEHVRDLNATISYDLTLVNGNPVSPRRQHYFEYHFSYDTQGLLKVYLLLLALYTVLTPVQYSAAVKQKHPITRLLTAALVSEYIAILLTSIHYGLFALNGEGIPAFNTLGDIMEIFAQSLFMLLLILLSMGWAVTRQELTCKIALFSLWALYTIVHCLLYIWKKFEVDVIEDIEEYQTVPGIIILVLRVIVMLVFLVALRDTMAHEYTPERIDFFLHFGAASLVWFIYLPIVAGIALRISKLWRIKFLIGIIYSADTFAYIVLMHLLWPSRSEQYYLLAIEDNHDDELEEFCQSANHLHDVNQNKRNNEGTTVENETEKDESVVSDLIDLPQQNQQL